MQKESVEEPCEPFRSLKTEDSIRDSFHEPKDGLLEQICTVPSYGNCVISFPCSYRISGGEGLRSTMYLTNLTLAGINSLSNFLIFTRQCQVYPFFPNVGRMFHEP